MNIKDKQRTFQERAKSLYERRPESEILFEKRLIELGIRFMPQKAFIAGDYYCIVDFYLPKPDRVIIEIDGGYHGTPEQIARDKRKDEYLVSRKFRVVRVKNEDVLTCDIPALIEVAKESRRNPESAPYDSRLF